MPANTSGPTGLQDASQDGNEPLRLNCPIIVGQPDFSSPGGTLALQIQQNSPNYLQLMVVNDSSSNQASADIVAVADNGTDSAHYLNAGINSSTGGTAPFTGANATYLYTPDNELDLGALGTTGVVNVYTTGTPSSPVLAGTFDASQNLTVTGYVKYAGQKIVGTPFAVTSSVTLANITGLSVNVTAGKNYVFTGTLYTTSNVAGGVQAAVGGTCTAANIVYEGSTQSGGTLTLQFAQNTSSASASTVVTGSSFIVQQTS